jgi:Pycsar effector protein
MKSNNLVPASQRGVESGDASVQNGLGNPSPSRPAEIAPVASGGLSSVHAEFASFHEGYVRHYIALADSKATISLGMSAGLLTYVFSKPSFHDLIVKPAVTFPCVQAFIATGFLVLSTACAMSVISPRLTTTGEGIIFFGSVAKYPSSDRYMEQVAQRSEPELTSERLQHCYDISKLCARKYEMLRRAIWFGCLGLGSLLPLLSKI